MAEPIRDITIVGGGTSGWMAACFLAKRFQAGLRTGEMKITLIESERVPITGVGESTARPMAGLLRYIGINESEFIKRTDATFKLSGYFHNWDVDEDGQPMSWVNPFFVQDDIEGMNPGYLYSKFGMHPGGGAIGDSYTDAMSICPAIIRACRGPKPIGSPDYKSEVPYSYHTNAVELAKILMERGRQLGVTHVYDDVEEVRLDDRGFVQELQLERSGTHPIEFVIDATGFASIIIGKAMGEPFEPYDKYVLNDRAAVTRLPHEDPTRIEPTSKATGMKAGWSFWVPLFDKVGSGYIYSSRHISDDEAVAEFKAHAGPAAADTEPRIIRMRIGKTRRSMVNNCLALGLSSGFVEPLEATAIYSVQQAMVWLMKFMPDSDFAPAIQKRYNQQIDTLYNEIIEFIVMMFHISNRDDSEFWRTARNDMPIPDGLQEKLDLWRHTMPDELDIKENQFFTPNSFLSALMGKGFYKGRDYNQVSHVPRRLWDEYVRLRSSRTQKFVDQLPDHYTLLRHIRGEADPARSQTSTISVTL